MTFTQAINRLKSKIQWLVNRDKLAPAQLDEYNLIIQELQTDYNALIDLINQKDATIFKFTTENNHQAAQIFKLEAICLLHGINNLPHWMNKPTGLLLNLVNDATRAGWCQLPNQVYQKFQFHDNDYNQHPEPETRNIQSLYHSRI